MINIELWNFVSECGLLLSLSYFGFRFLRSSGTNSPNIAQLKDLQVGLRNAIREADEAGRGLGDQLGQRKQTLEKLLFDLETVEHRVNRAITSAEERKGNLELEISKAKRLQDSIQTDQSQSLPYAKVESPQARAAQIAIPEAPTSEESVRPNKRAASAVNKITPSPRTNIYGEPIAEEISRGPIQAPLAKRNARTYSASSLSENIEKQVDLTTPQTQSSPQANIPSEKVYAAAEKLLRAGKAIEQVVSLTKLSTDEVRLLSQLVEQEQKESDIEENIVQLEDAIEEVVFPEDIGAPPKDQRLGVLGAIKRQTQII